MIKRVIIILVLVSTILNAELFKKRDFSVGVVVGRSYLNTTISYETQNYTTLGLSVNYFFIDNLSTGIEYKGWFGGIPTLNQFTLPITYYISIERYIPSFKKVRPYIGVFIRETLVSDGYNNYTSYAAKAGLALIMTPNMYISAGWIKENYVSCPKWQDKCSSGYPEVVFSLSF